MECQALPKGWRREEIIRKTGLSTGKTDVFYYSPTGRKFRSKPQLARYLGDTVDLTSFDYRTGKINSLLLRKSKHQKGSSFENIRGIRSNDASLTLPIRRTASIFKQPVTIVKTQPDSKVENLKHGPPEKPKQVFWEKRLQNLRATNIDQEVYENFDLPKNMRPVGPHVGPDTVLRSISTALHLHAQPITGQTAGRSTLEKSPGVFLNPDQPLVGAVMITDDDIKRQENLVNIARRKLASSLMEYELR